METLRKSAEKHIGQMFTYNASVLPVFGLRCHSCILRNYPSASTGGDGSLTRYRFRAFTEAALRPVWADLDFPPSSVEDSLRFVLVFDAGKWVIPVLVQSNETSVKRLRIRSRRG